MVNKSIVPEIKTGVYILTYPGDYHLALTLIKSLEYFNPDLSITILAGDSFNMNDHPFKGKNIYQPDPAKWALFSGYDKKFALFDGPYDRFLYADADMLCLQDISHIFEKMESDATVGVQSIYVNLPHAYYGMDNSSLYGDDREIKIRNGQLGNLENIQKFDGEYSDNIYKQYPFNTGLWAADKKLFSYDDLLNYKKTEMAFFKEVLNRPYDCRNSDLFYVDQGKLNYLVWKKNISVQSLCPHAHYIWGGKPFPYSAKMIQEKGSDIPFIHWAGCPRPSASLFSKAPLFYFYARMWGYLGYKPTLTRTVPGKDIWDSFCGKKGLKEIIRFTLHDAGKIARTYFKGIRRKLSKFSQ